MMFRGELPSQMDGVSMSSPNGSLPAEDCMNWISDQNFNKGSKSNSMNSSEKYQTKPSLLIRYEYDTFCVIENPNALENVLQMNFQHQPKHKYSE